MTSSEDKNLDKHFFFGKNWSDYSEIVEERRILSAEEELIKANTEISIMSDPTSLVHPAVA